MKMLKFKYVDKIKMTQDDTSSGDFGNAMHEIAENYKGGGKDELLTLYHQLVQGKYEINDYYRKKIPIALKNIHSYFKKFLLKQKSYVSELDLTVPLDDEITLTGKIDVYVETNDNRIRVVDYKTKKSYKWYDPKEQLAMYMLILNIDRGIPLKNIDTEIVYLSLDEEDKYGNKYENVGYENVAKCYDVDEEDVILLKREISVLRKRIKKNLKSGEWLSTPTEFNCTYCDYNSICEDSIAKKLK